ncbi:MAG TPA: hypothetical protein G4N96_06070 [Chloroflexi bacterium]|nr:hypothetical protein [Chloroflexota bacterium]
MKLLTILFGIILTLLGAWNYTASQPANLWALTPALYGALAILFGFLAGKWEHKHPLYGAVMMAILTLLSSLRGMWNLFILLSGGATAMPAQLIYIRSLRGILSVLFIGAAILLIKNFWQNWKAFGQFLGDWLARVLLTIFYFTVFLPFGIGVRLFSDPLAIKTRPDKLWRPRPTGDKTLEDLQRQF